MKRTQRPEWSNSYASCARAIRDGAIRTRLLRAGDLEFDEMALVPTVDRKPLLDGDVSLFRENAELRLHAENPVRFSNRDVAEAFLQVAREKPFHGVREYLDSLAKPAQPEPIRRLANLLGIRTDLEHRFLRSFLISAVARVYAPGCKVDSLLILVGKQGVGKSSVFRTLASDAWFSDATIDPGSKDGLMILRHGWIHELAELDALLRRQDRGSVKAFLSRQADRFRLPYGRLVETFPRTCVLVGTTNEFNFIGDPTGSRRFWPIVVRSKIDLAEVRALRDQVWAEARELHRDGERWWLTDEEERSRARRSRRHVEIDPWESPVIAWAVQQVAPFAVSDVLVCALRKPLERCGKPDTMRVAAILRANGYRQGKRGPGLAQPDQRLRLWYRPEKRQRNRVKGQSGQPGQPVLQSLSGGRQ